MSFIRDPRTAENIDLHGAGTLMNDVHLADEQKRKARALLEQHGALDLAPMLGIQEEAA